jgi:hypothetical protein
MERHADDPRGLPRPRLGAAPAHRQGCAATPRCTAST